MSLSTAPTAIDLIIPAYNEELSIGMVIRDIPGGLIRHVVVCDNNSSDDTANEASRAGAIVVYAPERGYGNACLAGIRYIQNLAPEEQPEAVIFMDGDYSDFPEEIPYLISALNENNDLVIGSRVTGKAETGSLTIPQQFGNWLATRLIKYFWGHEFTDLGPFRAIRWPGLLLLDMQDKTFGWTVEMQIKALKHKLQCAEIPVSYRNRIGVSKISGSFIGSVKAGYTILRTICKLV